MFRIEVLERHVSNVHTKIKLNLLSRYKKKEGPSAKNKVKIFSLFVIF